jgi:hypothetical protein
LKKFSILWLGKSVWCFDKKTGKRYKTSLNNIGCEKGFYSHETEHYLAVVESKASPVLEKIIENKDLQKLHWHEREILASFIAIQDNRTYELRETMEPVNKWVLERIIESMPEEKKRSLSEEQINNYINDKAKDMAIEVQEELLKKQVVLFANMLLGLQWILLENNTEMPLWTSDNPVNKFNPTESPPYMGNLGYLSSGIEIFLPLTPKLCLSLCDIGQHRLVPSEKIIMYSTENIIYQNHLVLDWSHRHIFSNEENFELAEKILKECPMTNKPKVEIA